jgi:hypothetical protein
MYRVKELCQAEKILDVPVTAQALFLEPKGIAGIEDQSNALDTDPSLSQPSLQSRVLSLAGAQGNWQEMPLRAYAPLALQTLKREDRTFRPHQRGEA